MSPPIAWGKPRSCRRVWVAALLDCFWRDITGFADPWERESERERKNGEMQYVCWFNGIPRALRFVLYPIYEPWASWGYSCPAGSSFVSVFRSRCVRALQQDVRLMYVFRLAYYGSVFAANWHIIRAWIGWLRKCDRRIDWEATVTDVLPGNSVCSTRSLQVTGGWPLNVGWRLTFVMVFTWFSVVPIY